MILAGLAIVALLGTDEPSLAELESRCQREGHGASCYKAAFTYGFGLGVAKDLPKAAALYERSCRLEIWAGCHDIAVMYERGEGVPEDQRKARHYYAEHQRLMQKACSLGNQTACRLLKQ
jgi:TPR repeat protein